ncbi:MAG: TonB-dependent receptor [Acidobacteria bacterium]|nr:TonB-dependent receptor [Acidobacteriota bacterium]
MTPRRSFVLAALALATAASAYPQASTASINGTLRDSSGSVVPGASLVLKNPATSVETRTASNEAGYYAFLNIQPGQYTLEVSKAGFRTNRLSQFTMAVNQTATLDVVMEVGSVTEAVTVEAIGAEVQASTSEIGAVVAREQVVDLPLNGRNFTQLLSLTPGVAPVSVSQNTGSGFAHPGIGAFIFPAINGQTNRSNFWTLDGITNQGLMLSTPAVNPIVDAIAEFKVQSHNDQAEFGGVLGGVINVATQSGTNSLHGSAWEYLRNSEFDARNTFVPSVTPFRQNQFGAAVGGPVLIPKILNGKNTTFFHGSYQGWRLRRANNSFLRVPTQANLTGDLSDEARQIFDPATTIANPNGNGFVRTPFPGNRIPGARISRGALAYAQTFPAGGAPINGDRNAIDPSGLSQNQEEWAVRVDRVLGPKDNMFFRISQSMLDQTSSGGRPSLASFRTFDALNIGTSWVHTFSPSTVLQVQFGRLTNVDNSGATFRSLPANFISDVGYASTFCCKFLDGQTLVPAFNIDGWVSGAESLSLNRPSDVWQYKSGLTKIKGNHQFKFGGEWNNMDFYGSPRTSSATYRPFQTSNPLSPGNTGSQLASYLLDVPDAAGFRNRATTVRRGGHMAFFFQDQWKLSSRLTFNYGIRYDKTFIPALGQEGNENIFTGGYDLQRGVYLIQKMPGSCEELKAAPCVPGGKLPANVEVDPRGKLYYNSNDNWAPRVGLAYRLGQRTAIRASFGMFYDNYAAVVQTAQNYSAQWPSVGEQLQENLNNPSASQLTPNTTGKNPFTGGALPAATPFNQVQWYMDPRAKNPYSMQWNFGVQHQISSDTVVTVNYVGSGTRRLDIGGFYNVATTPGPGDYSARSPFPYIRPTYYDRSWGRGNYQSFQFLLDKKFKNDFAYMINYTYSKAIDIGCSGWYGVEGCSIQNPYKFNNDRSVSGFDLTHVMTMNFVYHIPFGTGKRFQTKVKAIDYALGGWQTNGIVRLSSGQPYSLQINGDLANTGNAGTYLRLNFLGNPELSNPTTGKWFDTSMVAAPAPYTFGNSGRNRLRSDGWENFDISLFKTFALPFLGEGRRFEFRAEGFNMFNHAVYGVPNNNFSNGAQFGRVTGTANQPRQLQLGGRFVF